ncbi:elongator complex protein 3 [Collinsella tanakaei]|uniref:elongator complex protein 3 n=1 Tax=Collinsella tanakaei TaxID=626935 RepID=UPI0025A3D055|nr:tRNA uridine(34) 5-carboxymethylaminomethyl modification radical SAM/GNAT enzyme Elp3 [Collinsella tanakaei]MDM8300889.1 tRNA uridine(34) 5-carboxymethylaminomethyl modification radical SAM/GNAT enzyme Elp3 [Collinsella tanakaei]
MEDIIVNILEMLRHGETVDDAALVKLVHAQAKRTGGDKRAFAKRRLLPFYQRVKREEPERWRSWNVTSELERALLRVIRMKPRRSASGVATITVITKPWPCGSDCLYCPNDVRMPKSYLHDEPACARAEQNCFDPYLQVSTRLTALSQMGHATDKIELIILGGTWSDYPRDYQIWFVTELFRALNDDAVSGVAANPMLAAPGEDKGAVLASSSDVPVGVVERRAWYRACGITADEHALAAASAEAQAAVDTGSCSYNRAVARLYGQSDAWRRAASAQTATLEELERQQRINETARHRVVGLVVETRPDAITPEALTLIRRLGATKIQMGVQSTDQRILDVNERGISVERIAEAFALLRAFGFKIHAHAMANLLGATPADDKRDYARLMHDPAYQPDEVKLYPCALIGSARLAERYRDGSWVPYSEEELLDVLVEDVLATPAFCRISRMIRDFSSDDIVAGNKKPNLRQLVEARLAAASRTDDDAPVHPDVQEIRFREIGTRTVDVDDLRLDTVSYKTENTTEHFLQWVCADGRIAGFLRLSLPVQAYVEAHAAELPVAAGEAMIREVHVYGMATRVGADGRAAQHLGLGKRLIERACSLAQDAGYRRINVISAVGTREYYRHLGFVDHGLYQQKEL